VDVATILENIKSQALIGNTGYADDTARLMRYLNKAHTAIYGEIALINPALFQKTITVPVVNGAGNFPEPVFKVLSVIDVNNGNKKLVSRSTDDIERDDSTAELQGNPASYEQTFTGLTSYPRNSTSLRVRVLPNPTPLTENSTEADILIPPLYHEALEWATLWTVAYDERDKLVGSELQFTRSAYTEWMDKLRIFVASTIAQDKLRVRQW
jgi:hypothetical protein